uniref:Uncharacterized protein n=1 Tax=Labrus bergylta TaxID=56723 RepID=A0A3Q3GAC5_9LABR
VGVVQNAGVHICIFYKRHCAKEHCGESQEEAQTPDPHTETLGPGDSPQTAAAHWLHQSQVSVHADQHEEQNAANVVHGDHHVDKLTEDLAKLPLVATSDGDSPEGEAGHHDQVSCRKVPQVHVGHAAGFPLQAEHAENQAIAHKPHHADQSHVGRL